MTELREAKELSVEDVASRLSVAATAIEGWETGDIVPTRNPKQMLELCQLYDVTLETLAEAVKKTRESKDG